MMAKPTGGDGGADPQPAASPDWDPRTADVLADQIAAYDRMRHDCPVAHSDYLGWSLFGHADVRAAILDHDTFSNAVSRHPSVPNGMDPPRHTAYRQMIDRYFTPDRVRAVEPDCRAIALELVDGLDRSGVTDLIAALAEPYAVQVQCAFLGWPRSLHAPLRDWVHKNRRATLARDVEAMAAIALEFDGHIRAELEARRLAGAAAPDDITTALVREQVDGRPLEIAEIVSILRNWTVGELGTIAACIGIVAAFLAERPAVQDDLRRDPAGLPAAIEEILRLHAPLISNRRVTTRPVTLGGRAIGAGERITLIWASANRDEAAFPDACAYRPDRDQGANLLYGAGIHVCPGAGLARMELRVAMEALLGATTHLTAAGQSVRAVYPASGFSMLPMRLG